jgi:hypothetical protein
MIIDWILFAAAFITQAYFTWVLIDTIWKTYKREYPTYDAVYILISMVCLYFAGCIQLFAVRLSINGLYFVQQSSLQLLYNMFNYIFAMFFSQFMLRQVRFSKAIEKTAMLTLQVALMLFILLVPCVVTASCLNEFFSVQSFAVSFIQFGQVIKFDGLLNYINTWYIIIFAISVIIFSLSKKFEYRCKERTYTAFVTFLIYLFLLIVFQFVGITRMASYNLELLTAIGIAYKAIFIKRVHKNVFESHDISDKKPTYKKRGGK